MGHALSRMMVRTSAKSRLIMAGTAIRSLIPWMPWRSTSSAMRKASERLTLPTVSSSLSLGMMMRVSTLVFRLVMPFAALFMRTFPSKEKGLVTTPMVSMPSSRAHSATTGAAPVPVPPPMPAVMKTRSAPLRDSRI